MGIDLGSATSITDPATAFAPWIEAGDVHWSDAQRGWAVIGHDAVAEAFRDASTLSADRITVLERVAAERPDGFRVVVELLSGWMIFRDPPTHTRLRTPVRSAFTTRRVTDLTSLVEALVEDAFDEMAAAAELDGAGSGCDFTTHVARPVPALVIGALLGVDPGDRTRLQEWSDDLASIVFSLSPRSTPPSGAMRAAASFRQLFSGLVETARQNDDDSLVGRIAALDETFEADELVGMCTMLLFAGHETTTSLLQNMVATLLEQPALADQLRSDDSLIPTAVDEFLRVQGPARTMVRKVSHDHERRGATMRAGENVFLSIAAANHDVRVFDEPASIDLGRDPNPHLSFGWGLHHCLGAGLARLEGEVVLRALLRRHPTLESCGPVPPLTGTVMGFHRGPIRLATHREPSVRVVQTAPSLPPEP